MISAKFDEDYFERGIELSISLYTKYHYIAERSEREARVLVNFLKITKENTILDFGCAKGFLVKALIQLGYDAYGIDISEYAISHCEPEISERVNLPDKMIGRFFDFGFCKDVLEHSVDIDEDLAIMASLASRWLVCIPLADNKEYRIKEYEKDITHTIREDETWWIEKLNKDFRILSWQHKFYGLKDKWQVIHNEGDFFVSLESLNKI